MSEGDIVLAMDRPWIDAGLKYASVNRVDLPSLLVQRVARLRGTERLDNRFLKYVIASKAFTDHVLAVQTGTAVPHISGDQIKSFEFLLPPLREQRAIANILGRLDDKIEFNKQMNKTLEAMVKAIFKHWFVDFEFPNAEGKPYKSSGGRMVYDDQLGKEVPEGWAAGKLGEFIDLDKGLSYKGAFLTDDGIPMVNLGTIAPNAGFIPEGLKHYNGEYKERQLVKSGDVVIANTDITQRREVLGSPAIVPPYLRSRALFTHHVFAVRIKSYLSVPFIYYLLQLKEYKDRVKGFATGTTVLALPKDAILDFAFAVPDQATLRKFDSICSLVFEKKNLSHAQSTSLATIRDSLLPKLMSGKIRVPVEVR